MKNRQINYLESRFIKFREQFEVENAVCKVIRNETHYSVTGHPNVKKFEETMKSMFGSKYVLGTDSGTSALILALRAIGVQSGDEIIVSAFSFIANATSITQVGCIPIFVDIIEHDYSIDYRLIESKITSKTKAIIVTHLYGQPSGGIFEILKLAQKYNLILIEDVAQSFGASYTTDTGKVYAGTIGDIGCFSFSSTKPYSAPGNAGAIITKNEGYYNYVNRARFYGMKENGDADDSIQGVCAKMHDIHAAALLAKFPFFLYWQDYRESLADIYNQELSNCESLCLPKDQKCTDRVWYQYVIQTKKRDMLFDVLQKNAKKNGWLYPVINYRMPLPMMKVFKQYQREETHYPVSEKVSNEIISLPLNNAISYRDVKQIVEQVRDMTC